MNSAVSDHESLTLGYYWRPTKIGTIGFLFTSLYPDPIGKPLFPDCDSLWRWTSQRRGKLSIYGLVVVVLGFSNETVHNSKILRLQMLMEFQNPCEKGSTGFHC